MITVMTPLKAVVQHGGTVPPKIRYKVETAEKGDLFSVIPTAKKLVARQALTLGAFFGTPYALIEPHIGTPDNALQVPGETLMLAGDGGVGKTTLNVDMVFHLACGKDFLGYSVPRPLKVLFYQAELPPPYIQKKLKEMISAFTEAEQQLIKENLHLDLAPPFDMATDEAVNVLREAVEAISPEVISIDPFLSFFSGDENDNGKVRHDLDLIKNEILIPYKCSMIIADHQNKASKLTDGLQADIRGAGAKRDFAATVIGLRRAQTPKGESGDFLSFIFGKTRYSGDGGKTLTIRRNSHNFSHEIWEPRMMAVENIKDIFEDVESLGKTALLDAMKDKLGLSRRGALEFLEKAISEGVIEVETGDRNVKLHFLNREKLAEKALFKPLPTGKSQSEASA